MTLWKSSEVRDGFGGTPGYTLALGVTVWAGRCQGSCIYRLGGKGSLSKGKSVPSRPMKDPICGEAYAQQTSRT